MIKFATAKEHRDHFRKNRHVEFEGLLTDKQCLQLNSDVDDALAQQLQLRTSNSIPAQPAGRLFCHGRDLWRTNPKLKKLILSRSFAQTAADLIEHKPLRIAYDQFLPGDVPTKYLAPSIESFANFLKHTAVTLPEVSCIQGVICALMLCIKAPGGPQSEEDLHLSNVFPKLAGHGVFFAADMPIDFSVLTKLPEARYLMIVYSQQTSVYCHQEGDPLIHSLRNLGYNFGDKLTEQLNPLVYS